MIAIPALAPIGRSVSQDVATALMSLSMTIVDMTTQPLCRLWIVPDGDTR